MLKLYKRTLVISYIITTIFLLLSVLCEFISFSHSVLILNYSTGITCSLIVVIITTELQYLHEHARIRREYCSELQELAFHIAIIFSLSETESREEQYKLSYDWMKDSLDKTMSSDRELTWFSRKKKKSQEQITAPLYKLWLEFYKVTHKEFKVAVLNIKKHHACFELFDSIINFLPEDDYNKKNVITYRQWITEIINQEVSP